MKPESRFIARVNRYLPIKSGELYYLKLNLPYTRGVADSYYSSRVGDLWIEYKWLPVLPPILRLVEGTTPIVTKLQRAWLLARAAEGRLVRVFVGAPEGVLVLDTMGLEAHWTRSQFQQNCISESEAAAWIEQRTLGPRV